MFVPFPSVLPSTELALAAAALRCGVGGAQLGGLYFAKTYSAKSKNQYRNVVNRTLPNQESDKPYSAKPTSGIC